ncbi:ABC-type aliphatic sulfonate transporter, permease subunit [Corynebacterium glutamicum MB001]|uniref:ABC-type transporter, permease components n=1 Tax=Corynebacterium glutamicum (strain ATCC 13032 / DSM 20300 / JCM 1318 / BCRC 11384 / CCUG 27702 / LMG 3730 / NBRC 12168 / NCIMB 10025 / NRRL B-2784 / 534) TaxID=196627 RepID=Q8NR43_CORGL|nr:ABC transporter permease [Corynebacterium glutamicum]AGT05211.1 ABC-type aliphatic sulfonate transporter, permease subunit [Corynebacterium glutamicum MB001]ARV64621.1 ABC transporter permease [Corynebacterium glutamicum]ASW13860.1 ABC-type aliphatic sulfonate transporter, permease subunit [Corynebacterium glutamicum]AUI00758.1 ABC transporter permease [Corynebacterium glutamicum]AUI04402.1 ABC transporter permease [Corynebacterium glutamicum]
MTTTLTRPKIALPARIYSPLAVLVFWQLGSSLGAIPERILPAPTTILAASWEVATNGTLLDALLVSSQRVLLGFALGAVLGISLGVLTGMSRFADTAVDPLIQAARALPHLGLVPLFIIWFGIGELPKVLIISLGVLYPLYLNTASGFRQIDPKLLEAGHVMGFGFFQRLRTIIIPSAAPQLFVGLRQASAAAWLSLIVAEQVNAREGLGFLINNARDFYRTDLVIFGLIVYASLGLLSEALIRAWERHTFRYRNA